MSRVPQIVGNWKMYKTAAAAREFIAALQPLIAPVCARVCLAVPFTALEAAVAAAKGTGIRIGAQNMHDQNEGAFTGEISACMLQESGVSFVLLGHSERRQYFAETNSFIHRKVQRALEARLIPILCIGEQFQERERGDQKKVLQMQLEECLQEIFPDEASRIIIAYEPVWAIGTGKTATPGIAQEMHQFIRNWLGKRFGSESAGKMSLLYGGSVKPDNIAELMVQTDIDGALVGGASLNVESFAQIVNY
jgi:triosephosphate isomerase